MLVKKIPYVDYDGVKRTDEEFMFNLTEAELMEMHLGTTGGLDQTVRRIVATQDQPGLVKIFKDLILKSYGVKSLDGKRFEKEDENGRPLYKQFEQTPAYSVLFMELSQDSDKAVDFIVNILPTHLRDKALEASKQTKDEIQTVTANEN